MRKAFDRQQRLDCPSVARVSLNLNCRNETIPILRGLQHIYSTPTLRDSILKAIAQDVNGKSSPKHGRPGLSYWEILVLAGARLGCGYDYDQLQDLAENHRALRQVMGIGDWESEEKDPRRFDWRRIESNLNLLRPETIAQINQAIVEEGHIHERRDVGLGQGIGDVCPADTAGLRPGATAGAGRRDHSQPREAVQHL